MTQTHPITPPDELVKKIRSDALCSSDGRHDYELGMIHAAYAAGADQELEACCEWLKDFPHFVGIEEQLRAARRPKPPSLKEQALAALEGDPKEGAMIMIDVEQFDTIRRALEALPND